MSTKKGRYGDPRKRRPVQAGDLNRWAQPSGVADPRRLGGSIAGPGGSRDRGAVVIDMTDAVLLDGVDVATVDTVRAGEMAGQAIFATLSGRVNKSTDRVAVGFAFGPAGLDDLTRRLTELHQGKHVDLHFLRAAIDLAIEAGDD